MYENYSVEGNQLELGSTQMLRTLNRFDSLNIYTVGARSTVGDKGSLQFTGRNQVVLGMFKWLS